VLRGVQQLAEKYAVEWEKLWSEGVPIEKRY
jgi:hypothetical protein